MSEFLGEYTTCDYNATENEIKKVQKLFWKSNVSHIIQARMDDFISRLVVRGSNLERATETRYTWKVETFVAVTTTYEWDALPQYSLTLEQTLDGVTDFSNYFLKNF